MPPTTKETPTKSTPPKAEPVLLTTPQKAKPPVMQTPTKLPPSGAGSPGTPGTPMTPRMTKREMSARLGTSEAIASESSYTPVDVLLQVVAPILNPGAPAHTIVS